MLCNGSNPILHIVDVSHLSWNSGSFTVAPRTNASLAFRIKGSATVACHDHECQATTNDILYVPQNLGYTAEYTDTELIAIHFVTANNDDKMEVFSCPNSEELHKMFQRALSLWKNKEPGYEMYVIAQLYSILGAILEREAKTSLPPHFLKAISYINENYKNNALNMDWICAEVGICATTFRQLFRKHYQKTPTEYITDLRLAYARNLISGGMPIEIAAYESGFNDSKYFARVVKKYYGCTPRDFKTYGK